MSDFDFTIGDMGAFLDIPSPAESLDMYGDVEPYVETSASESQSPTESSFDIPSMPDLGLMGVLPNAVSNSSVVKPDLQIESAPQNEKKPTKKPAPKRKRENRYKNAPPAVLSRRRAQNRASQRAYRERKDQRIRDLETMLEEAKQKNEQLSQAFEALQADYTTLSETRPSPPQSLHSRSQSQPRVSLPYDMMAIGGGGNAAMDGMPDLYGFNSTLAGFPM